VTALDRSPEDIVCLVDDDPSVLKSTERLLDSDGFSVRAFSRSEEFLVYATSHPVPIVVLDIWMEHITGLEVLARLCALSPRTRVIVITGRDDVAARVTAMQIGPVAFSPKHLTRTSFSPPFTMDCGWQRGCSLRRIPAGNSLVK
jgi:FixJ family two-component response regulator